MLGTTQQERFYNQMKMALEMCKKHKPKRVDLESLTTLVVAFQAHVKNKGNNDNWRDFYEDYRVNSWIPCLTLRDGDFPEVHEQFADKLDRINAMAWSCQLLADPEGDKALKLIWEECGRIAKELIK